MTVAAPTPARRERTAGEVPQSLRLATEAFYWKPVWAFMRAFELEEFARAGVRLERPLLDLGSGDGTFAAMLRARGVLEAVDVALDPTPGVAGAARLAARGGVQADARALPLRDGCLRSVVSNAVICCLRTDREADVDRSLREVARILAGGGAFALTVATPWFNRNLVVAQALRRLGARRRAEAYLRRMDRGLEHTHVFDEAVWRAKLEAAGLRVERLRYYFTPRQAAWWNLLTLQPVRVFAFARLAPAESMRRLAARLQQRLLGRVFGAEQAVPQETKRERAGFLLLVARKGST